MSMRISIELPFFPGFYESDLMNSDTPYWAIKDELDYYQKDLPYDHPELKSVYAKLTEDDLDFNYADCEKVLSDNFVEAWKNNAPEIVEGVEFDEIVSPKYYNHSTDRLFAFITLRDGWENEVREFMRENADWLRARIKEDWTSYDGFMSYMSNNFDDTSRDTDTDTWRGDKSWYWHLFGGDSDRFECYLSTIIGYMMYRENSQVRNDLIMETLDDVFMGEYVFLTDEAKERIEGEIKEGIENGTIVVPDPDQLELPFPLE